MPLLQIDPKQSRLLITEPCFNLPNIQEAYDQVIFEEYEFASCYRTTGDRMRWKYNVHVFWKLTSFFFLSIAPQLCIYNDIAEIFGDRAGSVPDCAVIVDSGYSFTHIIPFFKGKPVKKAIKRCVCGKIDTFMLELSLTQHCWQGSMWVENFWQTNSKKLYHFGKFLAILSKYTLTNWFASYYDMMEETYIINQVKEECCYVSKNVYDDLDICR